MTRACDSLLCLTCNLPVVAFDQVLQKLFNQVHKNHLSDQVPKSNQVQHGQITQPLKPHFQNSLVNLLLISFLLKPAT